MTAVTSEVLERARDLAARFLAELPDRAVGTPVDLEALRVGLGGPLPEQGDEPSRVVEALAHAADAGLVATPGPRYFGFVTGGSVTAALAADWLTSAWDQNASFYVMSPAAAVAEEVAGRWQAELLGIPEEASFGFVTGGQMANFTALAAARHAVLARVGWDVRRDGLVGSPAITVIAGDEAHVTIVGALRLLGIGERQVLRVRCDEQGRVRAGGVRTAIAATAGPTIVCAQAGNVNTGAFDPFEEIVDAARARGAWVHVDGAFGLWASAVPSLRHLTKGAEGADSWAVDGHKWLNVPYDCGMAFVRDPAAHHAAMAMDAAYYVTGAHAQRDGYAWVPEASRRARGFTVWAALRSLGRTGVVDLIERCCALARRFADRLRDEPRVAVLNDVVLNQVLLRFAPAAPAGDADGDPAKASERGDAYTRAVIDQVQREGTLWAGGTTWHGMAAMRIAVSNWSTTPADIDRSADAICRAIEA